MNMSTSTTFVTAFVQRSSSVLDAGVDSSSTLASIPEEYQRNRKTRDYTFYKSKNSLIKSRISHGGSNRQRAELSVSLARTSKILPVAAFVERLV